MSEEKKVCARCGKEIEKGKFCSRSCWRADLKENGHKGKCGKLDELSNKNKCYRCGKPLPSDWISAYCTACENRWEI